MDGLVDMLVGEWMGERTGKGVDMRRLIVGGLESGLEGG